MKFEEFANFINGLKENEGKLYDSKGRFRATYLEEQCKIIMHTRYCVNVSSSAYICGKGWVPITFVVVDNETGNILCKEMNETICIQFLNQNYPNYQDPMAYWS